MLSVPLADRARSSSQRPAAVNVEPQQLLPATTTTTTKSSQKAGTRSLGKQSENRRTMVDLRVEESLTFERSV